MLELRPPLELDHRSQALSPCIYILRLTDAQLGVMGGAGGAALVAHPVPATLGRADGAVRGDGTPVRGGGAT